MRGQAGFWDIDERYVRLSEAGDPLEKLNSVVPWEVFLKPLAKALKRSDGAKGGRPPYDAVMMFKIMVLQRSTVSPMIRPSSRSRIGCPSCAFSDWGLAITCRTPRRSGCLGNS